SCRIRWGPGRYRTPLPAPTEISTSPPRPVRDRSGNALADQTLPACFPSYCALRILRAPAHCHTSMVTNTSTTSHIPTAAALFGSPPTQKFHSTTGNVWLPPPCSSSAED